MFAAAIVVGHSICVRDRFEGRTDTTVSSAVMSAIALSGQAKKSRSGTVRSASRPSAIVPLPPTSLENHATRSVHMRSAVSRSRQVRCGVNCRRAQWTC